MISVFLPRPCLSQANENFFGETDKSRDRMGLVGCSLFLPVIVVCTSSSSAYNSPVSALIRFVTTISTVSPTIRMKHGRANVCELFSFH